MTDGTPPKARGMGKAWAIIAIVVLLLVLVAGWLFWTDDEVPQVTSLGGGTAEAERIARL